MAARDARAQCATDACLGSSILTVVPAPMPESIEIAPPAPDTGSWTTASPGPVPSPADFVAKTARRCAPSPSPPEFPDAYRDEALAGAIFLDLPCKESEFDWTFHNHSHRNQASTDLPAASGIGSRLNPSGGPLCGSMQVACSISS